VKIAAISQNGLTYAENAFDVDRYQQLGAVAASLFSVVTGRPDADLRIELGRDSGYATPKVEVRGVLFDDSERVLLMRERTDGLWALPGGWADPLDSPSAAVVREIAEETGYPAEAVKLIACWDRDLQGHLPTMAVHVYKVWFLCRVAGQPVPPAALETLEIGWFDVAALPPLSLGRVHPRQIQRALEHHRNPQLAADFD
jgi:ADP-ribose pyrophosphatase YjhB (NUDIX family)